MGKSIIQNAKSFNMTTCNFLQQLVQFSIHEAHSCSNLAAHEDNETKMRLHGVQKMA